MFSYVCVLNRWWPVADAEDHLCGLGLRQTEKLKPILPGWETVGFDCIENCVVSVPVSHDLFDWHGIEASAFMADGHQIRHSMPIVSSLCLAEPCSAVYRVLKSLTFRFLPSVAFSVRRKQSTSL